MRVLRPHSFRHMKRTAAKIVRFALSVVYAYLIFAMSGFTDLAYALSCTDVISSHTTYRYNEALYGFKYFNGKTYALALSGVTGRTSVPDAFFAFSPGFTYEYINGGADSTSLKAMIATGKYGAARPVAITSQAVKDFVMEHYGPFLAGGGGSLIDAWKEYGTTAPFNTIAGGSLPYTSWGTPPNTTLPYPSAVSMDFSGNWAPTSSGTYTKQIVEMDGQLDCAIDPNLPWAPPPPETPTEEEQAMQDLANYDGLICVGDLNNNGEIDGTFESGKCTVAPQGDFCPVGALNCDSEFQPVICPSGSVLNPERDMCQKDPDQVNCPTGYTWDQSIDKCVMIPPCADGGMYNNNTNRCEKLVMHECPVGYEYDPAYNVCQMSVTCPSGGVYVAERDRCEAPVIWCSGGFVYNADVHKCQLPPYCPSGWSYSSERDRCEILPNNCPAGYTYNSVLDKCVVDATCPSGGVLNITTDKCELAVAITCQDGWVYNSTTTKCEKSPICLSPGTFDGTYDVCLTPQTGYSCPTGYTYSASLGTCISAPICTSGTYDSVDNRCEASLKTYCSDPSYTYNATRGRCEKAPVCPSGMTYNTTYNVCTQAITKSCLSGYTYNATRNRCEKAPVCPTGTSYNASTNRCESTPTCSSGTYNSTTNQCVSTSSYAAVCPSGYTWNGSACVKTYGATLSGGVVYDVPVFNFNLGLAVAASCTKNFGTYGYATRTPTGPKGAVMVCNVAPDSSNDGAALVATLSNNGEYFVSPVALSGFKPVWVESAFRTLRSSKADMGIYGYVAPTPGTYGGTYSCPSGGTLSGTTCTLTAALTCPSGGTLSGTTCTTTPASATCPSGTSLNTAADKCIANPTCSGGFFDGTYDVCYVAYTPTCSKGTYDAVSGLCTTAPTCTNGSLDGTVDKCYQASVTGCPSGYSLSGGVCYKTPTCTSPGTFTASADQCTYAATIACPTGYAYSASYGQCYKVVDCAPGSLNSTLNVCQMAYTIGCPTNYIANGSVCQKSPDCAVGGTYNTTINFCNSTTSVCTVGTLDTSVDFCYQAAGCDPGSVLQTTRDMCEQEPVASCATEYLYDSTFQVCQKPVSCNLGSYQPLRDRCEATVTLNCGTYAWSEPEQLCLQDVTCPTSSPFITALAVDIDRCVGDPEHICAPMLEWNGAPVGMCEAVPICEGAIFYDPVADQCLISVGCPYGDQYTCMQNPDANNTYQCSPYECINVAAGEGVELESFSEEYFQDDGEKDEQGNCLGQIYIFNGKPSRCRTPGWTVGYINNCCEDGDLMPEDTGSGIGTVAGAYSLYQGVTAAYWAYQGFGAAQQGVVALSEMTTAAHELGGAALEGFTAGADAAINGVATGATQSGTALSSGLSAMGPGIAVYASGAIVAALGGDQDAQLGAQIAAYSAMIYAGLLSGPQAAVGIVIIAVMRILMGTGCDANDIMTANDVESKRCVYIGTYCEKKILGACVQKAKGHCCFSSILSRIIHEQGRPQLTSFQPNGAWGPAKKPNCRGFTPEEFQSIDFSKIDLTEYYGTVLKDIEQKIQGAAQNVTSAITNKFQQIQNNQTAPVSP